MISCLLALDAVTQGNIDDKRWLPVSSSAGNLNSSATMVTRAALTLWYYMC